MQINELINEKKTCISNFLVTINLNERNTSINQQEKFYYALIKLFFYNYDLYKKQVIDEKWEHQFKPPFLKFYNIELDDQNIDDIKIIDVKIALEAGPKTGNLHAHCMVTITHTTRILIDKDFIVNNLCYYLKEANYKRKTEIFPYKVYVNVQFVPLEKKNYNTVIDYLNK